MYGFRLLAFRKLVAGCEEWGMSQNRKVWEKSLLLSADVDSEDWRVEIAVEYRFFY